MKKRLLFIALCIVGIMSLSACGKNETIAKTETKDEMTILNPIKSVTDDLAVKCDAGKCSELYYYDYKMGGIVCACGQKNCSHNLEEYEKGKNHCDAVVESLAYFPFVYNDRLYFIVDAQDGFSLWSCKRDGTDKTKEVKLDFTLNTGSEGVRYKDKIYVSSREEFYEMVDENNEDLVGAIAEVYEIDLSKKTVKQLTNFGKRADAVCAGIQMFNEKLIVSYECREKTCKEAGFGTMEKYFEWLQSDQYDYQEDYKKNGIKKLKYAYDLKSEKMEFFDIGFQSNFKGYQGIENLEGAYTVLCCKNDTVYYLEPLIGEYSLYSYNIKTKERKKLFSSFINMETVSDDIIYITSMEMDEITKNEVAPSVDLKQPPKYYSFDLNKGELKEEHFGEEGKVFYVIDRNEKGLLVNETDFDENCQLYDEHDIREIEM
ncbi:MAG: hypothetical protein K6G64_04455 [Eubacterium sp.]|nr:hypothetical protein [Eubacterium sp.]